MLRSFSIPEDWSFMILSTIRRFDMRPLQGQVALVAGATRGAGRGIACAFGDAGATVYCSGRSVHGKLATKGRRETIEETAAMVTARGGKGVAVRAITRKKLRWSNLSRGFAHPNFLLVQRGKP